ncbi:MAG: hypothetical protein FJZ63_04555 [Chlamydiae bacterium]|nr:hypothetical protein [Chlamydiota bacterium]
MYIPQIQLNRLQSLCLPGKVVIILRSNNYFWRTYDQKEIDWVEEREGKLFGYEFKWSEVAKPPKLWLETYPEASFESIHQSNYFPFIT